MEQILLIFHVLAAIALVGLVLLQQGKGAEMGASFGSGASQTLFGSSGSIGFLARATGFLAFFFFATSFGLAIVASDKAKQTDEFRIEVPAAEEVPANVQEMLKETDRGSEVPVVPDIPDAPDAAQGNTSADDDETPAILQEALEAEQRAESAGDAGSSETPSADDESAAGSGGEGAMPPQ